MISLRGSWALVWVSSRRSPTHANLSRLAQLLRNVLCLLDRAADELLEKRDLDRLRERVRQRQFRPDVS